jgi:hypothetical protein
MNNLSSLIFQHYQNNSDIILSCHQTLKEVYPALIIRWARIYGRRWAYIYGSATGDINLATVKVKLNKHYGLCIDNANLISPDELDEIKSTLKELFNNDRFFSAANY